MLLVVTSTPLFLRSIQNCGLCSNINYSITYAFIHIFAIYFSVYPAQNGLFAFLVNSPLIIWSWLFGCFYPACEAESKLFSVCVPQIPFQYIHSSPALRLNEMRANSNDFPHACTDTTAVAGSNRAAGVDIVCYASVCHKLQWWLTAYSCLIGLPHTAKAGHGGISLTTLLGLLHRCRGCCQISALRGVIPMWIISKLVYFSSRLNSLLVEVTRLWEYLKCHGSSTDPKRLGLHRAFMLFQWRLE